MSTTRRLYLPSGRTLAQQQSAEDPRAPLPLDDEEAHYGRVVLRLPDAAQVELMDGSGAKQVASVHHVGRRGLLATLVGQPTSEAAAQGAATLLVAVPKGERADWLVEKACELGVGRLVWVAFERATRASNGGARASRWLRLARAAGRQAQHGRLPAFAGPCTLTAATAASKGHPARFVAMPGEGAPGLQAALQGRMGPLDPLGPVVVIGPEGGLTPGELQALTTTGYSRVSLGPHVLRLETAAIVAAAACLWASSASAAAAVPHPEARATKDRHG